MNIKLTQALAFILFIFSMNPIEASPTWPLWEAFKRHYISNEGRVIDPSSLQKKTTSEGQSYGLFFALVANDQPMFAKLLHWTEKNLASGDLGKNLPAWEKGQNKKKQLVILDPNSASDADIWIAYDLLEAGRLWNNKTYDALGKKLLQTILKKEVASLSGFGLMVLPGRLGFSFPNYWRLNPSYIPPQLMARFAMLDNQWKKLENNSMRFIVDTSPQGFAPDWIIWKKNVGWKPDLKHPNTGSYDAIRVYLWIGMLSDDIPQKADLIKHFWPMITLTNRLGFPPEEVNVQTGQEKGKGPLGFAAALLPLFQADSEALSKLHALLANQPLTPDSYYTSVLRLFGEGWEQKRYRFTPKGQLTIANPNSESEPQSEP